jgi:hypothetical protein
LKFGGGGDDSCVFCQSGMKRRQHLFFNCGYYLRLWREGVNRCNVLNSPIDWEELVELEKRE